MGREGCIEGKSNEEEEEVYPSGSRAEMHFNHIHPTTPLPLTSSLSLFLPLFFSLSLSSPRLSNQPKIQAIQRFKKIY